ncbi:MAG: glycosyl transferase [Gammaproteobacteria bacterium]|nr:MAG: glycosyl transferase [Gammaproteobacteria bacterium]
MMDITSIKSPGLTRKRKLTHSTTLPEEKISLEKFSPRLELSLTWSGIVFTLFATLMVSLDLVHLLGEDISKGNTGDFALHFLLTVIVASLIYGGLVYQFARIQYVKRLRDHAPASREALEELHLDKSRSLSILVPSYKEESLVVEMTLMSAALQDYPNRYITLLIDDPAHPDDPDEAEQLMTTRRLPGLLQAKFEKPRHKMEQERANYFMRVSEGSVDLAIEYQRLAELYSDAAEWLKDRIGEYSETDPASKVFIHKVLYRHRTLLLQRVTELRALGSSMDRKPVTKAASKRFKREYNRLVNLFSVSFSSFERKRYVNLSHEPNKAMNLNSYLGLMGKGFKTIQIGKNLHLIEAKDSEAELLVPHSDYVITLDADSLILTDYALRLTHFMEQPGNERIAVVQTPYSAFPTAASPLERVAGATTDIQYIIHQGFTGYGATYWVGANALIRRAALEDIVELEEERGFTIKRYIQDRTVIEDTESTIDLVSKGWQLHNYPERLAYSATPPDFGSLLIQRRRWANGGLIILPKLMKHLFGRSDSKATLGEAFMRIHYLASIAAVNIALLLLLAFPITGDIETVWLPLTAAPYFFFYWRDLMQLGYHGFDILRVYALNLLLIPINLGGVFKSLQQAFNKTKIPFGRTPKVEGRTSAPAFYIFLEYVLVFQWIMGAGFDFASHNWAHGSFAMVNAIFLGYAIWHFIGVTESVEDLTGKEFPSTV